MNKPREKPYVDPPILAKEDWRLHGLTTTTAAVPEFSLAAGAAVKAIAVIQYDLKTTIVVGIPNVSASLLDFAERLWLDSNDVLTHFRAGPDNVWKAPLVESDVLDLIERRMSHAVFAYTALEAFANQYIHWAYTQGGYTYSRTIKGRSETLTLEEVERHMRLDEKLAPVLVEIFGCPSPKGRSHWDRFRALTRIRNHVIHPKLDAWKMAGPKDETIWNLLLRQDFRTFATSSKELIEFYFSHAKHEVPGGTPRWINKWPGTW